MSEPIVVDLAKALQQLQADPDLADAMNKAAFGAVAMDQIEGRDRIIMGLVDALFRLSTECRIAGLEAQPGFDVWLSLADEKIAEAKAAL